MDRNICVNAVFSNCHISGDVTWYAPHMTDLSFDLQEQAGMRRLNIHAVIMFGSHALGVAREQSDYDVFVIGRKSNAAYDYLYDLLSSKIQKLVNIDIVFESRAPMELQHHVAKRGLVLYQETPSVVADFRERVMLRYADFAPLRHLFQQATLDRIAP